MEKKFIIKMDVPDELYEDSYFNYESDSIGDCLDALGSIYHEAMGKDVFLGGCLFTIKGVKGTFRFDGCAWEDWFKHGDDCLFLSRCKVLESLEQRVEDILNTLKCGYRFRRMPMSIENENVEFMCECPYPVSRYGMKFNFAMTVGVYTFKDGSKGIEYGSYHDLYDWDMRKGDCIKTIMEKSGMGEEEAEKAWDDIAEIMDSNMEAMIDVFGPEFERRLPDVEIVDRNYYHAFLVAS